MATSSCVSTFCGAVVEGPAKTCPKCNGRMHSAGRVRAGGVAMLIIGGGVAATVAYGLVSLHGVLAQPGVAVDGTTFSGTPDQARLLQNIMLGVLVFALGMVATGTWQATTGRRNRVLTLALFAMSLLFVVGVKFLRPAF